MKISYAIEISGLNKDIKTLKEGLETIVGEGVLYYLEAKNRELGS